MLKGEKFKECGDCKKRDSKIGDLELRIKDLIEYIKKARESENVPHI
jgi:hypothetical protein